MWLFTTRGFYSVVRNRHGRSPALMIRSRSVADLEALRAILPKQDRGTPIHETTGSDYPCRIFVSRRAYRHLLRRLGDEITYENFKNACPPERKAVYGRVWSVLLSFFWKPFRWQDEQANWQRSLFDDVPLPPLSSPDEPRYCYCDNLIGGGVCSVCLSEIDDDVVS